MTNENSSDRLDRIEAIVESNARAIQAMAEQQATDRLKHDEAMAEMRDIVSRLTDVQRGMAKMLGNIDETQPTMLRRLMAIENKVDILIERADD